MAHIMVVDDQDDIRDLMSMLLQLEGHQAIAVADGDLALAQLRAGAACDLVVTDMHMKRMNGDILARTLAGDPRLARVPIIILSGDVATDLPPNVVAQIPKPLDVATLLHTIQQTLRGSGM